MVDPLVLGVALRDWLLSEGARLPESGDLLAGMAERLNDLGVPVDRATTAIDAWVHDSCGFQTLDLTSSGGKLGPAPEGLRPGPVSIKFSSTGDPSAFVVLLARVKDGQKATAADVDAGRADFEEVAEVVGAAQPTGPEPPTAPPPSPPGTTC